MKSSQVMARIEAAGWKRIRADGSHFTYEHPKYGRRTYAKGRPQSDVSKRLLLNIIDEFHLTEIEAARIAARLEEAKRRPEPARVALARITPDPEPVASPMTDQEMRLLWAQLHRDHKLTLFQLRTATDLEARELTDFLYHDKPLGNRRDRLVTYLLERERLHKLTRSREELRRKGYGARIGAQNSGDPDVPKLRQALQEAIDQRATITELAEAIGVSMSTIHGIKSGKSKTVYPAAKAKLMAWYAKWTESDLPAAPAQAPTEPQEAPEELLRTEGPDDEITAILNVLAAIKGLNKRTAQRALRYALDRTED